MEIIQKEIENNVKIVSNHLNEIKEIERVRKRRSMEDVMNEEEQIKGYIAKLKKEIFELKNQDVMNSRNLLTEK